MSTTYSTRLQNGRQQQVFSSSVESIPTTTIPKTKCKTGCQRTEININFIQILPCFCCILPPSFQHFLALCSHRFMVLEVSTAAGEAGEGKRGCGAKEPILQHITMLWWEENHQPGRQELQMSQQTPVLCIMMQDAQ